VATCDHFSGLAHGVVDTREFVLDDRVQQVVGVAAFHRQGDGFNTPGDDGVAATGCDLVGGDGDGLQARRAVTVQGRAGVVDAQFGQHGNVTADVETLGAFVGAAADDAVVDQRRVDPGTFQQSVDAMSRHVVRTGHVELAAVGLGHAGPNAVDDNYFTHAAP